MFSVFGFYKFKKIKNLMKIKKILHSEILYNEVRGTIIISKEGINGTLSGNTNNLLNTIKILKKIILIKKFDLIFIDADKENYIKYYDLCFHLISNKGLILIDNVLWKGEVIDKNKNDRITNIIRDFNTYIKNDDRIEKTILPIGDGITICRKI